MNHHVVKHLLVIKPLTIIIDQFTVYFSLSSIYRVLTANRYLESHPLSVSFLRILSHNTLSIHICPILSHLFPLCFVSVSYFGSLYSVLPLPVSYLISAFMLFPPCLP